MKEQFLALLAERQQSACHGMVSIVFLSFCPSVSLFLVYTIKSTFSVGFLWNLQFVISSLASTLLILKKIG